MKKKLKIRERAKLLEVLPQFHNYKTMKAIKEFIDKELVFTEDECRKFSIETVIMPNGARQLRFDDEASQNYQKEMNFDPLVAGAIVESLKNLDKQNKITVEHLPVWEKFIG